MIEKLFAPPRSAGVLFLLLDDRPGGSTGLLCLRFVLLMPDRPDAVAELCRELSQLGGPRSQTPCRVARIIGKAAPEDFVKLQCDLAAGRHNIRRLAFNRAGDFLIDVEVPVLHAF